MTSPTSGVELSYRVWTGEGSSHVPDLVLVHGLGSTMRIWDFVAPLLAGKFRVVAYDQRGHASSEKPEHGYDFPTLAADLAELVAWLDLHNPVIVGHSWGASVALAYAGLYPGNCAGLGLVDGGLVEVRDIGALNTWESARRLMQPEDLSTVTLADLKKKTRSRGLDSLGEEFIEEFLSAMIETGPGSTLSQRLSSDNHMRILRTIWDTPPESLLSAVQCPTLVITALPTATSDEQNEFNTAKMLGVARAERLLPNYKAVLLLDTIHDVPLQRPERLAREILDYFAPAG